MGTAGDEEGETGSVLYQAVFQLWGDADVKAELHSLSAERQDHFFHYFREFVEDTYRDLLAKRGLRGAELYVEEGSWIGSSQALSFAAREAVQECAIRASCPLTEALVPSVGRRLVDQQLLKRLKEHYIPRFGLGGKGPALFEQNEALAGLWTSGRAGIEASDISATRRRPCALSKPGKPMDVTKAWRASATDFGLFAAEEDACIEGTLISEPQVSIHGNVMALIRDTTGEISRMLLYDLLPPGARRSPQAAPLGSAMFPRGTRVTVLEPLPAVARDGVRGTCVLSPSELRKTVGGADSLDLAMAKAAGNDAVSKGQHAAAAEFYRLGLNHADTEALVTLLSNRAQAELKLEQNAGALADTAAALQLRPTDSKAWARYALALRGLGCSHLAARAEAIAGASAPSDCGEVWPLRAAARSAVLAAAKTPATVVGPGEKPQGSEPAVGDAATLKAGANDEYKLGKFGTARGGYTKALACEKKAADAAASLGNLAHCCLVLGELHNVVAAATACLRFCPPPKVAAKAAHRLALALALLGETGLASEVLAACPVPDGIGDVARQCAALAEQVESLGARQEAGYSAADLLAAADEGGSSATAEGSEAPAEWLGPVELKSTSSSVRASRDVEAGEVVLVQRPLKGPTFGVHGLTSSAAAELYLRPAPEGISRRLAFASCTDVAAARAIEVLGAAWQPDLLGFRPPPPADVLGVLLQRFSPRLLPLLGQRPDFAPAAERLPVPQPLIEALAASHQSGPAPGWRRLLAEARGDAPGAPDERPAQRKTTGLYPAIAMLGRAGRNRANCALAPVGPQAAGALAVFTTRPVQRGAELLLQDGG